MKVHHYLLKKTLDIALSLESAISQTTVIQSGYMNSKSGTEILKVSNEISLEIKLVKKCYLSDRNHAAKSCPFINKECFYCHNKGHTSKVCCKKAKTNKVKLNNVVLDMPLLWTDPKFWTYKMSL